MDELHSFKMTPSINKFSPIIDNLKEGNDIRPSKENFLEEKICLLIPFFIQEMEYMIFNT